jgi:hypothetical protein
MGGNQIRYGKRTKHPRRAGPVRGPAPNHPFGMGKEEFKMTHITKKIETEYKGYKFSSRLEAQFAVLLELYTTEDPNGIQWEYKIQEYKTTFGDYTPDFYLPMFSFQGAGAWVEVTEKRPTQEEMKRLLEIVLYTEIPGFFFFVENHIPHLQKVMISFYQTKWALDNTNSINILKKWDQAKNYQFKIIS